jgi:hypothetical protein
MKATKNLSFDGLKLEVGTRVETLESRSRVGTLDLDRTPRDSRETLEICNSMQN